MKNFPSHKTQVSNKSKLRYSNNLNCLKFSTWNFRFVWRLGFDNWSFSRSERGFIALISLIIIAATTLLISISVNLLSMSESQMGLTFKKGQEAFMLAESCLEEALIQLGDDVNYDPDGAPVVIDEITCDSIDVTGGGINRNINVEASVSDDFGTFTKKLRVQVRIADGSITITSWRER